MSARGIVPVVLTVAIGIGSGFYIFNPMWEDVARDQIRKNDKSADLGPNMIEVPVENVKSRPKPPDSGVNSPNAKS